MPRIAASTYLNSAPLIWSFLHGERSKQATLIDAVPARCAMLLVNSDVDVALVPVIEYQRIPNLLVVPDVCVGSRRQVRSVVLVSRCDDLQEIRSVALDESSRTSATLVKVIFREFVGHEPTWSTYSPDLQRMLSENDAALIIGDPGMTFSRDGIRVWDMASLWNECTNLGFVFAMWMVRKDATALIRNIDFVAVCDEGLVQLEDIVRSYVRTLGLSNEEIREYLTENISFSLDENMKKGMQRYFELAKKHRLIEEIKELQFIQERS